jgi:hypothetical protein
MLAMTTIVAAILACAVHYLHIQSASKGKKVTTLPRIYIPNSPVSRCCVLHDADTREAKVVAIETLPIGNDNTAWEPTFCSYTNSTVKGVPTASMRIDGTKIIPDKTVQVFFSKNGSPTRKLCFTTAEYVRIARCGGSVVPWPPHTFVNACVEMYDEKQR